MVALRRGIERLSWTWAVAPVVLTACGQVGQEAQHASSPFTEDTVISGVVVENVTACVVDAACYLRIQFADTTVVALYGTGERPAPVCTMTAEVSDAAFPVQPHEVVEVVISMCGEEGYYLRRVARVSG